MKSTFFLSSHDYISSPEPRTCQVLGQFTGTSGRNYFRVCITPPIPAGVLRTEREVTEFYLLLASDDTTLDSIGSKPVFVYIFFLKHQELQTLPVRDDAFQKVGTGMLHASIEDALKHSAIGD